MSPRWRRVIGADRRRVGADAGRAGEERHLFDTASAWGQRADHLGEAVGREAATADDIGQYSIVRRQSTVVAIADPERDAVADHDLARAGRLDDE